MITCEEKKAAKSTSIIDLVNELPSQKMATHVILLEFVAFQIHALEH